MGKFDDYQHIYCLFCRTGAEYRICEEIHRRFPNVYPLATTQEKHKIVNKQYEIDRRVFLPGYLFLYAKEAIDFDVLLRMDDIYRMLGNQDHSYELQGSDRAFAEWLLKNDGLIGISRITTQNNKIKILSGPMKYFTSKMIKLDKHTKNALVRMDFLGTTKDMWLAFRFEDEVITRKMEDYKDEQ